MKSIPRRCWPLLALGAAVSAPAQTIYTPYHFTTVAGQAGVKGSADGVGSAARFYTPQYLGLDSAGNIYVSDLTTFTVRKITPTTAGSATIWTVTTLAGSPGVAGSSDGTGASASFNNIYGLYVYAGLIFVSQATSVDNSLRQITPAGVVTTIYDTSAGENTFNSTGTANTSTSQASVTGGPTQLLTLTHEQYALDLQSDQFECEPGRVPYEIAEYGSTPVAISGSPATWNFLNFIVGAAGTGSADGPMSASTANFINGIATDTAGSVFFTDETNHLVRKVTPTVTGGVVSWYTTTLGGVALNAGNSDGTGAAARFSDPTGIAVDTHGTIYVADTSNSTIRMGVPDTGPVAANATANAVLGQPVTFTLPATDPFGDPITFAITGTTGGSATLSGNQATFTPSTAGTGTVTFTASDGYVTSSPATVTISTIPAQPVISLAAASQTVATGRSVAFNAQATGYPTPTYQWTLNGSTTIPGAAVTNDSILLVAGATAADAGTYVCTATNVAGTATTSATLTVATTGTPPRLDNLSARAEDLSGGNILIAGLTVGGSGTEPVLLRAVGPGLVNVNLDSGLLPNPVLTVFDHNSVAIVSDAGWGNAFTAGSSTTNITPTAATSNLMIQVGAFPINAGSTDSAMEVQMAAGSYTLEATDANGAAGVALAEVYDAGSGGAIRLTNISARADVGAGGDILIGGLTISGDSAETVLLRAVGPGLVNQNLPNNGLLAQPSLAVYQGSTQIYSNTGWGSDPVINSAFTVVGATSLLTADSAVLITLPAGGYTVLVSGVGGTSGIGLVEVYEVY